MVTESGRPGEDESGDADGGDDEPAAPWGEGAARMFDAEEFNITWTGVRPGVDYMDGSLLSEEIAAMVRRMLLPYLKHGSVLDGVQAMTDLNGNSYVTLRLGAAAMVELVDASRVGFRLRGDLAGDDG